MLPFTFDPPIPATASLVGAAVCLSDSDGLCSEGAAGGGEEAAAAGCSLLELRGTISTLEGTTLAVTGAAAGAD